ncbi:MAG: hypothetical protein Tsb009_09560 [Planctomycetaceae bacterium]
MAGYRFFRRNQAANGFGILMYHRITDIIPGKPTPTWNVTPKRFYAQLRGLLSRGYTPRALRDVLSMHIAGRPIPPRTFVVTFDDGYANNFLQATPILKKLGVPATVFLATAYLDSRTPFPFDDWSAAGSSNVPEDSWRPLTTDECRAMSADGLIEIGAHTHSHGDFRNRPDELRNDLEICKRELASRFGIESPTFAFPYGTRKLGFSGPQLSSVVQQVGMQCSLTTESELVTPNCNPFDWGRFTAEGHDTAATLSVKLDGTFQKLRQLWGKLRDSFSSRSQEHCESSSEISHSHSLETVQTP